MRPDLLGGFGFGLDEDEDDEDGSSCRAAGADVTGVFLKLELDNAPPFLDGGGGGGGDGVAGSVNLRGADRGLGGRSMESLVSLCGVAGALGLSLGSFFANSNSSVSSSLTTCACDASSTRVALRGVKAARGAIVARTGDKRDELLLLLLRRRSRDGDGDGDAVVAADTDGDTFNVGTRAIAYNGQCTPPSVSSLMILSVCQLPKSFGSHPSSHRACAEQFYHIHYIT